jgi:NAD+ synthase
MRGQLAEAGAKGFVFGLSGGVDSAVVARLCQMAAPHAVLGVILPCHSDPQDERDARLVADRFALPTITVDLAEPYDALVRVCRDAVTRLGAVRREPPSDDIRARVPLANVKPRLRMATLYFLANQLDYLVVGTGNRSELTIGYFTKYGDGAADLLPLARHVKSDVRAVAKELGVPQPIIDKTPSAGLWIGQTDEGEMGFSYADLEAYLDHGADAVAPAAALRIERLMRASEHKRALPPMPPESGIVGKS